MKVSPCPTTVVDRADEHVRQIDRVAQDVGRHAVAGLVELEAPRQQTHRIGAVHREEAAAVVGDLAESAVVDQLLGVLHQRRPAVVVADTGDHAGAAGWPLRSRTVCSGVPPTGFSQKTCLPASAAAIAMRLVQHVRRADADDVDVGVVDDLAPVGGAPLGTRTTRRPRRRALGTLSPQMISSGSNVRSGNSDGDAGVADRVCAWPIQPKPMTPIPRRGLLRVFMTGVSDRRGRGSDGCRGRAMNSSTSATVGMSSAHISRPATIAPAALPYRTIRTRSQPLSRPWQNAPPNASPAPRPHTTSTGIRRDRARACRRRWRPSRPSPPSLTMATSTPRSSSRSAASSGSRGADGDLAFVAVADRDRARGRAPARSCSRGLARRVPEHRTPVEVEHGVGASAARSQAAQRRSNGSAPRRTARPAPRTRGTVRDHIEVDVVELECSWSGARGSR